MKRLILSTILIATLLMMAGLSTAAADEPSEPTLDQQLDQLLPGMAAEEIAARRESQQKWQEICFKAGAPGNDRQRMICCYAMIKKLGPDVADPARVWLLEQLRLLGRGDCVDAVAACLDDESEHVVDAARRALANNPTSAATEALAHHLQLTKNGQLKVGLLNALGYRGDAAATGTIARELSDKDPSVAIAAARALGKIGTPKAAQALESALGRAEGELRRWVADSYLLCADKLLAAGNSSEAVASYKKLNSKDEPRSVRLAALRGVIVASGDEAGQVILDLLAADDVDVQTVAAGSITKLGTGALKKLAAGMADLPEQGQIYILGSLAAAGDKSVLPQVLQAIDSENVELRKAVVRALGRLGDVTVVPMLVQLGFSDDPASGEARTSLQRVYGPGVDQKIVDSLKAADDLNQRRSLIEVIERRRMASAASVLIDEAKRQQDAGVRSRAMSALRAVAQPEQIAAMIPAMLQAEPGRERDEAEKTVMIVAQKIKDMEQRDDAVLALYARASNDDKKSLLSVLGRIGGSDALKTIEDSLKSSDPETKDAAMRAISNWPTSDVADRLLQISQGAKEKKHAIWTLRAFVRVIALPGDRNDKQKLGLLEKAMQLAQRDEERNLILERAAALRIIDTLRFVLPYLNQEATAQRAARTIVDLAHHRDLREPNQDEFNKALKKVIELSQDRGTVDRAKRYME
jgi:HEAT repeat protein